MKNSILVNIADHTSTMQAMHLACAIARNTGRTIVLLRLMPVQNPLLLGTEFGLTAPTLDEEKMISEYGMIAEDYGVSISIQPMQYESFSDAMVQAAEQLNPAIVIIQFPKHIIPVWRKFQIWNVRRQLTAQGRQFYTLEQPEPQTEYTPTIRIEAVKHR